MEELKDKKEEKEIGEEIEKEGKIEIEKKEEINTVIKDPKEAVIPSIPEPDFYDVFISESNRFDVSLKFYKKGENLIVEDIDNEFNASEKCKEITVTLKYPDQSDCYTITSTSPKFGSDIEKMDIRDFMRVELTRFVVLARKWSVNKELTSANIMNMNPKIIKGLVGKIRTKIGMDGIF